MLKDSEGKTNISNEGCGPQPIYSSLVSDQSAIEHGILIRADERKRIARELYDSTSELLAALHLNLGRLRHQGSSDCESMIAECEAMIAEIGRLISPTESGCQKTD